MKETRVPVAFAHVPKTGGTSLQALLESSASDAGLDVLNTHLQVLKHTTLANLRTRAAHAQLLTGHNPVAFVADALAWHDGHFAMLTLLRNPFNRLESSYRYHQGKGTERAKQVMACHRNGADILQAGFDAMLLSRAGGRGRDQAAWIHAPPELWRESGCPTAATQGFIDEHVATCPLTMHPKQLRQVFEAILKTFAVVGILERMPETLEVLRCRVPWFKNTSMPKVSLHSQVEPYPITLRHNASLMGPAALTEAKLYEFGNALLKADLECCRAATGVAPLR